MSARKNLGDILEEAGRVTPEDVRRALEHQRAHGGYFGQALVALGIVRSEEVEWALASQFDLPLVFPDPASVDPEAVRLVTPEWALANMAVPIVRTREALTVVVEDPLDRQVLAELGERTGLRVELALASPGQIRKLVHSLYMAPREADEARRAPAALIELIDEALDAGMNRLGISERDGHAIGWFTVGRAAPVQEAAPAPRVRRRLAPGWEADLAAALEPFPFEPAAPETDRLERWSATLIRGGFRLPVQAQVLAADRGVEYLLRPLAPLPSVPVVVREGAVPESIIAELRLLGRTGVRIAVTASDPDLAASMLPRLPGLVWNDLHVVHVGTARTAHGVMTLIPESGSDPLVDALTQGCFDAMTVDLPADEYPLARLFDAAPIVFVRLREPDWARRLEELGIGWTLAVDDVWELRAVRD